MFIQNNSNMQRSSKSIVVKQRGAAGAGSLPTGAESPAGTEREGSREQGARRLASPERTRAAPSAPCGWLPHSCQIYLEQEVST